MTLTLSSLMSDACHSCNLLAPTITISFLRIEPSSRVCCLPARLQ